MTGVIATPRVIYVRGMKSQYIRYHQLCDIADLFLFRGGEGIGWVFTSSLRSDSNQSSTLTARPATTYIIHNGGGMYTRLGSPYSMCEWVGEREREKRGERRNT